MPRGHYDRDRLLLDEIHDMAVPLVPAESSEIFVLGIADQLDPVGIEYLKKTGQG